MRGFSFFAGCAAMTVLLHAGCDRPANGPTTAPAATPVARPAPPPEPPTTTQASASFIWVDSEPYQFPPARLVARIRDDQFSALLFSDDPRDAINDDYTGNSYYLEMANLDASPEAQSLNGASWHYKAPSSDREDTVSGIFLHGRKKYLQPFDVRAEFSGAGSPCVVRVAGTFLMFESEDVQMPGKLVMVRAELPAELRVRTGAK